MRDVTCTDVPCRYAASWAGPTCPQTAEGRSTSSSSCTTATQLVAWNLPSYAVSNDKMDVLVHTVCVDCQDMISQDRAHFICFSQPTKVFDLYQQFNSLSSQLRYKTVKYKVNLLKAHLYHGETKILTTCSSQAAPDNKGWKRWLVHLSRGSQTRCGPCGSGLRSVHLRTMRISKRLFHSTTHESHTWQKGKPDRATISWSLKPILLKMSLMWGAPLAASGRRPSSGQAAWSILSLLPGFQLMTGPVHKAQSLVSTRTSHTNQVAPAVSLICFNQY